MAKRRKDLSSYEKRRLRFQQIVFITIGVIVILSMVISLVVNL
jgi:predicted nucleic acid-binding Zn ribbon protein